MNQLYIKPVCIVFFLLILINSIYAQIEFPFLLTEVEVSESDSSSVVPDHDMVPDPLINHIIHETNFDSLVCYVRVLSGEDSVWINGSKMRIQHRVSRLGNDLAADYIVNKLQSCNLEVYNQVYSATGRNVYAIQRGYLFPDKQYILCAHYDAVTEYAADDNASGVAAVLESARILSQYDAKYTLVYALWDDEERGLWGSEYYASLARSNQEDIRGVLNMDMLAWDSNNDGAVNIHRRSIAGSDTLAELIMINNSLYEIPLSPTIYKFGTQASDHSSFWKYEYGAILLMEAYYGKDFNPYHHTLEDRIDKFDLSYFHNLCKLSISTISTLVEITDDPISLSVSPNKYYRSYSTNIVINSFYGSFMDSQKSLLVWLSKGEETIEADSVDILSNTSLSAFFHFPEDVSIGFWDVNVYNATDGILSKENGFEILTSPAFISVSADTLNVSVESGAVVAHYLTIHNIGASELSFDICSLVQNNALQFDGVDDEVLLGNNSSLDISGDITICAWFKTETPQWGSLISNFDQHRPDNGYELCIGSLYENGGFVYFECVESDIRDAISTYSHFDDGKWHFVSAVLTPNGISRVRVFVDAIEQSGYNPDIGCRPIPSIGLSPDYPLKLGSASNTRGPEAQAYFQGNVDEVRIWDRALSLEDIKANMFTKLTGTETGLAGYWNFEETTSDTIFDLTGNGNHGILKGGVTRVLDALGLKDWVTVEPDSGICVGGSKIEIVLYFDARELIPGEYSGWITLFSNDPFNPTTKIPIHLSVTSVTGFIENVFIPTEFKLEQNYPNPFNPKTVIRYALPVTEHNKLCVYNNLGQKVATLVDDVKPAGQHSVEWNADKVSSGVYYYRLEAEGYINVKKMVLIK